MLPIKEVPVEVREKVLKGWTWDKVVKCLGITAKKRFSGVLVCRCTIHFERTPSMWLRPNGRFKCYGCKNEGDMFEFFAHILNACDSLELKSKLSYLKSSMDVLGQLYFPFHESWRSAIDKGFLMLPSRMI